MAGKRKPVTYTVDSNGCWNCTSHHLNTHGYPGVWKDGRGQNLHRVLYEEAFRPLAPEEVARHTCDNRLCINLDHVIPGTHRENMDDRNKRNRHNPPVGVRSGTHKLTPEQVRSIRESNGSQYALAAQYGVNQSTISRIKQGERWAHL
jgi:hypothetical protein